MLTIAFTDGTIRPWEDDEAKHIFWHSSAHLMAEALEALYPGVKFGVGPAVETGFYYDVDLGDRQISDADLAKVEAKMIELARTKETFERSPTPLSISPRRVILTRWSLSTTWKMVPSPSIKTAVSPTCAVARTSSTLTTSRL